MSKRIWCVMLILIILANAGIAVCESETVCVSVGDIHYSVESVQAQVTSMIEIYDAYGIDYDSDELINSTIEQFVMMGVLLNRAAEEGLTDFTFEEEMDMRAQAEETYQSVWEGFEDEVLASYPDATDEEIEAFLEAQGYTVDAYTEQYEQEMVLNRLIAAHGGEIELGEAEIEQYYNDNYVEPSRAYYENNIPLYESDINSGDETFYMPTGYRRVKQILIPFPTDIQEQIDTLSEQLSEAYQTAQTIYDSIAQAAVDGEDVETLREEYKAAEEAYNTISAELKNVADSAIAAVSDTTDKIYDSLADGVSFDELMTEYSTDTNTEGYLIHADSELWDETFQSKALALSNIGDVSEPFANSAGVHIIYYAADEPGGAHELTDEEYEALWEAALLNAQNERLGELYESWKDDYEIETHPELIIAK